MTDFFLKFRAWTIHAITASGALVVLLGYYAISQGFLKLGVFCMLLTIVIDSIDGPLARYWQVTNVVPNFDGARLDYIIDFSSWVLLPAFYIMSTQEILSTPWNFIAAFMLTLSSSYQFCCIDLKSTATAFKRWPSPWSMMLMLMLIWQMPQWFNFILISACVFFSFVPLYYAHPFRRSKLSNPTIEKIATAILTTLTIVFLGSILVGIIYYPTYIQSIAYFQQLVLIGYCLFCLYGSYKHWS